MKNKVLRNPAIANIATVMLILMWTYAASSKLLIHEGFRFQLLGHDLIKNYARIIAWGVPAAELFIVILLFFSPTQKAGLYLSTILLSIFTVYIIYMFRFYPHVPCSCGGIISRLSWKGHVAFNLGCIAVGIAGSLSARSKPNTG